MTIAEKQAALANLLMDHNVEYHAAKGIVRALSWSGKSKGHIKAKIPKGDQWAAGAWLALMLEANPYKVNLGNAMELDIEGKHVMQDVSRHLKEGVLGTNIWKLDIDRKKLEEAGVY